MSALSGLAKTDGNIIVGDGTAFVVESGATARTSLGVGTGDSPQFNAIELGHATDTTLSRGAAGFLAVEGKRVPSPASQAAGDILYRGADEWERLPKGTAAQVLQMNAGATAPEWVNAAASGWDMTGQTWQSVTRANNTVYQNTTGKPIQLSAHRTLSGSSSTMTVEVSPDNSAWTTVLDASGSGTSATSAVTVNNIIPPGYYYKANSWGSGMRELR